MYVMLLGGLRPGRFNWTDETEIRTHSNRGLHEMCALLAVLDVQDFQSCPADLENSDGALSARRMTSASYVSAS